MEPDAGEAIRLYRAASPSMDDATQLIFHYDFPQGARYPRGSYFLVLEKHRWMMAPDGRVYRYRSIPRW